MLETNQPWNLFGYDLRHGVHYFRAGWSDFLWGDRSPVLGAIDEVVQAHTASGQVRHFLSGKPVSVPVSTPNALAVILPDSLVLARRFSVPAAAEAELEAVVGLEVKANSPFPEDDTCFGSAVIERTDLTLDVQLVLSSRSAVMAHIAEHFDSHDVHAYEVWAQVNDRIVMLSGFGEQGRKQRNRRRLGRMASIVAYCLIALVALFGFSAGWKYLELQKVQSIHEEVESAAVQAMEFRTELASDKALIGTVNSLLFNYPSPHDELKRLTSLLEDGTYLVLAEMEGRKIRIEGESIDASAVMQQLLDDPTYKRVHAPVAFKKQRSGKERFVLELSLHAGGEK